MIIVQWALGKNMRFLGLMVILGLGDILEEYLQISCLLCPRIPSLNTRSLSEMVFHFFSSFILKSEQIFPFDNFLKVF